MRNIPQINKTYKIQDIRCKPESKKYPSGTGHPCQIIIEPFTIIEEVDDVEIPQIPFKFNAFSDIKSLSNGTRVGIIYNFAKIITIK